MYAGLNHHLCLYMVILLYVLHPYMLLQSSFITTTHYTLFLFIEMLSCLCTKIKIKIETNVKACLTIVKI